MVSIERIETANHQNLQETYAVIELNLEKLFREVLKELKKGFLSKLPIKILLYAISQVSLSNIRKGYELLGMLIDCIRNELYTKSTGWGCDRIRKELKKLRKLTKRDYMINGWLRIYDDDHIDWHLKIIH